MNECIIVCGDKGISGRENVISNFKVITEKAEVFSLLEFEMDIPNVANELNVYKKDEVDIVLEMISPSKKIIQADAFYYESFNCCEKDKCALKEEHNFRFRITPFEEGLWNLKVIIRIKEEIKDTLNASIYINENNKVSRFLKVESINRQVFENPNGEPVIMIGENLGVIKTDKDSQYLCDTIISNMKKLSQNGGNHIRLCDCRLNDMGIKSCVNKMNQRSSYMWDKIFRAAEEFNIYITFVMMLPGEVSIASNPHFDKSIWHKENGGYITEPEDFFTNRDCIEAFKNYVRYVISRWGYSESLLAWELFSAIDYTSAVMNGNIQQVCSWLDEMTDYINRTDVYGHMKSVSVFFPSTMTAFYRGFDFVGYHQRNYYGVGHISEMQRCAHRAYNCPVIIVETGLGGAIANISDHPLGKDFSALHIANWAGVMGGGASTAMYGDWSDIEKEDAFNEYNALSKIARMIPWKSDDIKQINTYSLQLSNKNAIALGYIGTDFAYLWICDNQYLPINKGKKNLFYNTVLKIKIKDSVYKVKTLDTHTGEIIKQYNAEAKDGFLSLLLTKWSKDIMLCVEK